MKLSVYALAVVLALLSLPTSACAQANSPSGGSKAPGSAATGSVDTAKIERYMRRYFGWPATVKVSISEPKPSSVAGLMEVSIKLSHEGQEQQATYLVSADGQYLLQGPAMHLAGDPFAATREKIDISQSPSLGSPLARITVVEYSDFQCGFCRGAANVLRGPMIKTFSKDVRLVYKDFPLSIHAWAMPSAALGRCIYKQNADSFWDYHDWIFAKQPELTEQNFKQKALEFAKTKGLDPAQLGTCMEQADVKAEVQRSLNEGQSVGVSGTPTLFINGRKKVGVRDFEDIKAAIEAELAYMQQK